MKYHTIKGHRCEVKKALSKEDLQQQGQGGGGGMRGGNYLLHSSLIYTCLVQWQ